jgi:phage tail-like protein
VIDMAQFPAGVKRLDPYKNFKFRVYFVGQTDPILAVSKVSALKRTTEVVSHRDGAIHNHSYKAPGRSNFDAITLERGVTHDPAFEEWANKVWATPAALPGAHMSLADFRRDLYIEVLNEAGTKVIGYTVYRCWVSEYQSLGDFDANANAILFEHIKVENEGWTRDDKVTIPTDQ